MLQLNSRYVADAIMSTVGNSGWFKSKGTTANEYPKEPYFFIESELITEEDKQREVDKFFA